MSLELGLTVVLNATGPPLHETFVLEADLRNVTASLHTLLGFDQQRMRNYTLGDMQHPDCVLATMWKGPPL